MDPYLGPSPTESPCLGKEGSFPVQVCIVKMKAKLRLKQHKFYSNSRE